MPQGFARDLNLGESDTFSKDQSALDNIAGQGISNDILLFSNNLRNKSVLYLTQIEMVPNTNTIRIVDANAVAFSNRTIVTHAGVSYRVVNSNGIDEFELVDLTEGNNLTNVIDNLTRSDAVTKENLINMYPDVLNTIDPIKKELLQAQFGGDDQEDAQQDPDNPLSLLGGASGAGYRGRTISSFDDSSAPNFSLFNFKKRDSILSGVRAFVDQKFEIDGTITITNDASAPITIDAPGIFIVSDRLEVDAFGNTVFDEEGNPVYKRGRAFSSNTDPWETEPLNRLTKTNSTQANIFNLIMTNPNLEGVQVTPLQDEQGDPTGEIRSYTDFTHKILVSSFVQNNQGVYVEGEPYNLLCIVQ